MAVHQERGEGSLESLDCGNSKTFAELRVLLHIVQQFSLGDIGVMQSDGVKLLATIQISAAHNTNFNFSHRNEI